MRQYPKWRLFAALACSVIALMPARVFADDTDIFVGASGGSSDAPNIMILVDNSDNWSRQAQHWPDNGGTQGAAELAAISSILNTVASGPSINIGLAMLTSYAGGTSNGATPGAGGGYIRFGARDMTVAANRIALQNIISGIISNITSPNEKIQGMASKDEAAGLYELYKYFSGMAPFSGIQSQNANVDVSGNAGSYTGSTAYGRGLTSGFAIAGGQYQSPISSLKPCARNYIIYIANNANQTGSSGQSAYEPRVVTVTALPPTSGMNTWTDDWTKYLYMNGAVVPQGNNNGSIATYVLDAYNAQQNAGYSNSLMNAAKVGGGRYFQVGSQAQIITALSTIFAEIQGVNSTFASASLPVNATSRGQDLNQVFIPMFRPDANASPRWMGNLKRYQIISTSGDLDLGDASGNRADNPTTGFLNDCATSYWTTDSGTYWNSVVETPVPKGRCTTTSYDPFSDAPDGPIVEKGGVAEVIRKGNNAPTTNTTPTWAVNRNVYTVSGSALTSFTAASSGLSASLVNFIRGQDVNDENGNSNTTETRPSLHGDAVHSRPLPVDYGGATGVTVYYGSNDGMLRAVDANTGNERWALVAPEFFSRLQRLMDNSPLVNYPSMPAGVTPTPQPKDYFFDGSIGLYQNSTGSSVWIYPTMRRGGRMIYALDVSSPSSPSLKWKAGCPNLTNDTGCTSGMTAIGQTWSRPNVAASVNGYATGPVVIVGGGYDTCEDANSATPSCASAKGSAVYVLDAGTGAVIKSFPTTRSVAADVALISVATPGTVDHAYAADLGGNIYRIDFTSSVATWTMNRVAYTNNAGRKFFFSPAVLTASATKVYLALGSGDREHPLQSQYPYANVTNRLYVYLDDLSQVTANNLDDTSSMIDMTSGSDCATPGVIPSSNKKGWFMNLPYTGEQTISGAIIAGGMVAFNTNRPIPPTAGTCSTVLGEARGYWVNLFNGSGSIGVTGTCGGLRSTPFIGGGMPPSPVIGVVPVNGTPTTVVIGAAERNGGASGAISPQSVVPPTNMKRRMVYWKSGAN